MFALLLAVLSTVPPIVLAFAFAATVIIASAIAFGLVLLLSPSARG